MSQTHYFQNMPILAFKAFSMTNLAFDLAFDLALTYLKENLWVLVGRHRGGFLAQN